MRKDKRDLAFWKRLYPVALEEDNIAHSKLYRAAKLLLRDEF